jgi:hypothetical protein
LSEEKKVHTPDYDGPDRRNNGGRRPSDLIANNLKLAGIAIGIVLTVFSMGGGWMAAKIALENKVSKEEFVAKNTEQDKRSERIEGRAERLEATVIDQITPMLRRLDERVTAIYCANKPPGCK